VSVLTALPPLNPVLARELKQRMRGRHVWLVLTLYLAVLALILRWVYVAASQDEAFGGGVNVLASATAGRAIFQWLLFFMLLLVCFIVPGLGAGAISGERERQTLIALQLTLLRPRSIVVGKLLASLAFVLLLVVASLPLLTIPFLVGGVSLGEVARGLLMVLATAVTLACLTLACSALLRRTQAATVVAYGVTLALVLGTLLFYGAQQIPRRSGGPRPDPWILALNPFAATADVVEGRTPTEGFTSPFRPLVDLLRLSEQDRLTQVFNSGSAESGPVFVGPDAPPTVRLAPVPFTTVPGVVVDGTFDPNGVAAGGGAAGRDLVPKIGPPGIATGSSVQGFIAEPTDGRVRLAGVRFWLASLCFWLVLAEVAVILTVRRIRLPARRESP